MRGAQAIIVADWQRERAEIVERLRAFRQIEQMPGTGGPLDSTEIWRREFFTHTEMKLTYEGEVGERIPAYLLIPRTDAAGRLPAVLACHQCARLCDVGKEQVVGKTPDWPEQAYGLELVREGFVVLAPDAGKVGERCDPRLRRPWERCMGERMPDGSWAQDRCCTAPGGTWGPIRWKSCFDVMRAIDFLCQYERVDATRIGAIGHSLGADTITWTMPLEPRIAAAAISGGGIVAPEPGFTPYGIPYAELLKAMAPRPFFEVTGHRDYANARADDPADVDQRMSKKRAAHEAARAVYAAAGAGEALGRFEHEGPHCFPEPGRKAAYAWLKRWLTG